MDYLSALEAVAPRFTVVPDGSKLEWTLNIQAPPDAGGSGGLALSETIQQFERVELPITVDLSFLGKWVRSGSADLPADVGTEDPIGGMPIVDHVVVTVEGTTRALPPPSQMESDDPTQNPGVPELLGRIAGTISQTVERVTESVRRHPVAIAVRWRVVDDSTPGVGAPALGVAYRTSAEQPWRELPESLEFPGGGEPGFETPRSLSLQFPIAFSELKSASPDVMRFRVQASIRLGLTPPGEASPRTTGWIDLPPVPLVIPTIPIPTILVLCEERDFAGRKLALVPSDSLVGADPALGGIGIGAALDVAASALNALAPASRLLGFLAGSHGTSAAAAAGVLKSLVPSPGQTIVAAHSRVDNLSASEFVFEPGPIPLRLTGEDMASSIISVGRPGTVFDFFRDRNLNEEGATRLQITLDARMGCAIRKLDRKDPAPDVVYGGGRTSFSPNNAYEDITSSLALVGPATRFLPPVELTIPTGPIAGGDDMQPGEMLGPEQAIHSANGGYRFIYQLDGNLVLYRESDGTALWAADTIGLLLGVCIMQDDGNLVIYGPGPTPVWESMTWGNPGSRLVVQDDGNVVIYGTDGAAIWATDTAQP